MTTAWLDVELAFDPTQPRAPKGSGKGGEWVAVGTSAPTAAERRDRKVYTDNTKRVNDSSPLRLPQHEADYIGKQPLLHQKPGESQADWYRRADAADEEWGRRVEASPLSHATGSYTWLSDYCNHGYEEVNSALRRGAAANIVKESAFIDDAFERSPLRQPIHVYRGTDWMPRGIKKGMVVADEGYVSTTARSDVLSRAREQGAGYDWTVEIQVPAGVGALRTARYVGTGWRREQEILLERGLRFKVMSVDRDSWGRGGDVTLRVVGRRRKTRYPELDAFYTKQGNAPPKHTRKAATDPRLLWEKDTWHEGDLVEAPEHDEGIQPLFWDEHTVLKAHAFSEADHPRHPKGDARGGEFASSGGGLLGTFGRAVREDDIPPQFQKTKFLRAAYRRWASAAPKKPGAEGKDGCDVPTAAQLQARETLLARFKTGLPVEQKWRDPWWEKGSSAQARRLDTKNFIKNTDKGDGAETAMVDLGFKSALPRSAGERDRSRVGPADLTWDDTGLQVECRARIAGSQGFSEGHSYKTGFNNDMTSGKTRKLGAKGVTLFVVYNPEGTRFRAYWKMGFDNTRLSANEGSRAKWHYMGEHSTRRLYEMRERRLVKARKR